MKLSYNHFSKRCKYLVITFISILMIGTSQAFGQRTINLENTKLEYGTKLFLTDGKKVKGILVDVRENGIEFIPVKRYSWLRYEEEWATRIYPFDSIEKIKIKKVKRKGILIGVASGMFLGGVIGSSLEKSENEEASIFSPVGDKGLSTAIGAFGGALLGGIVGGIVDEFLRVKIRVSGNPNFSNQEINQLRKHVIQL